MEPQKLDELFNNIFFCTIIFVLILAIGGIEPLFGIKQFSFITTPIGKIIEFTNDAQGIITLVAIGYAVMLLLFQLKVERETEQAETNEKQKYFLKGILRDLAYLSTDKEMIILGEWRRISHLDWLGGVLRKYRTDPEGFLNNPEAISHPLLEVDHNFYSKNLLPIINEKSTKDLVNALRYLGDKILIINSYSNLVCELLFREKYARSIHGERIRNIYDRQIIPAFDTLSTLVPKIESSIKEDFGIILNENEIRTMARMDKSD